MPKRIVKTGQEIAKKRGIYPLEVLYDQLEEALADENKAGAFRLALEIAPYVHRKMANQPADEVSKAISEGRLVVLGLSNETE